MNALTITAKGQITLRKRLLQHLGANPGSKLEVHELPGGRIELRVFRAKGKISDAFDLLKTEGRAPLSIEDMNDIIAKGWAGQL